MKKENIYKLFNAVSIFLMIGFAVRLGADYLKMNIADASAPFYAFVIERAVEFVIPGIAIFIAGRVVKRKYSK